VRTEHSRTLSLAFFVFALAAAFGCSEPDPKKALGSVSADSVLRHQLESELIRGQLHSLKLLLDSGFLGTRTVVGVTTNCGCLGGRVDCASIEPGESFELLLDLRPLAAGPSQTTAYLTFADAEGVESSSAIHVEFEAIGLDRGILPGRWLGGMRPGSESIELELAVVESVLGLWPEGGRSLSGDLEGTVSAERVSDHCVLRAVAQLVDPHQYGALECRLDLEMQGDRGVEATAFRILTERHESEPLSTDPFRLLIDSSRAFRAHGPWLKGSGAVEQEWTIDLLGAHLEGLLIELEHDGNLGGTRLVVRGDALVCTERIRVRVNHGHASYDHLVLFGPCISNVQ
jgi:hypothetical protein